MVRRAAIACLRAATAGKTKKRRIVVGPVKGKKKNEKRGTVDGTSIFENVTELRSGGSETREKGEERDEREERRRLRGAKRWKRWKRSKIKEQRKSSVEREGGSAL